MRYDVELFLRLNAEYKDKPLVAVPPQYDAASLSERSARRAANLDRQANLAGKRVLEIGCGRGEVCRAIGAYRNTEVVGVDVAAYPEWSEKKQNVTLLNIDLTAPVVAEIGTFDLIYSNSVWEHVRHPYTMLRVAYNKLRPGGRLFLSANLYRGPKASHRYREVFFPWPHLLFSDDVFEEFYVSLTSNLANNGSASDSPVRQGTVINRAPKRAAWINQLSIADYLRYFEIVGFHRENVRFSITPIDEPFYLRFADILERFPRYDLERDFIHAVLQKPEKLK